MVYNFLNGGAGINAIAGVIFAEVEIVDIGVDYDFPALEKMISMPLIRSRWPAAFPSCQPSKTRRWSGP
jgi:NaMN:DMB phosphoribosyltransferase